MFVSPVGFFAINAVTAMSPFSQYLLSFLHVSLVTPPRCLLGEVRSIYFLRKILSATMMMQMHRTSKETLCKSKRLGGTIVAFLLFACVVCAPSTATTSGTLCVRRQSRYSAKHILRPRNSSISWLDIC